MILLFSQWFFNIPWWIHSILYHAQFFYILRRKLLHPDRGYQISRLAGRVYALQVHLYTHISRLQVHLCTHISGLQVHLYRGPILMDHRHRVKRLRVKRPRDKRSRVKWQTVKNATKDKTTKGQNRKKCFMYYFRVGSGWDNFWAERWGKDRLGGRALRLLVIMIIKIVQIYRK